MTPNISIIIPAYNCEKTITQCLNSILNLDYPDKDYDVIVIDDGSTDTTADKIKALPNVKYVYQNNAGPAAARNQGAKEARGEWLVFTDSDCVPQKDWLNKLLSGRLNEDPSAIAGSYGIANPWSMLARVIYREIIWRHHRLMPLHPRVFASFNLAIKKKVFDSLGGFHEGYVHASGEDNDLSYRLLQEGYKICFAKDALVDHYHPDSLIKYLKEQYRHGFWRVKIYLRHPRMSRGDDYTFWKDPAELLLVVLLFGYGLIGLGGFFTVGYYIILIAILITTLNVIYSIKVITYIPRRENTPLNPPLPQNTGWAEMAFLMIVMSLRAFARTMGFLVGVLHNMLCLLRFQKKSW